LTKDEAKAVLSKIRMNYSKSFSNMDTKTGQVYLEIWQEGLADMKKDYADKALKYYLFEYTGDFAPTIGQFLAKCHEYRVEYERQHPVIRNAWETRIDG